jgi:hypothetical protein
MNLSKAIHTETGVRAIPDPGLATVLIPFGITGVSARVRHHLIRMVFRLFTGNLAIAHQTSITLANVAAKGVGAGGIDMARIADTLILVDTGQRTPLKRNRLQNVVTVLGQDGFETWEAATFVSFRRIKIDTVRRVDSIHWSGTWVISRALVLPRRKERQLATDFRDRT